MAEPEKRCRNCGAVLPGKTSFCLTCGAPQEPRPAPAVRRRFPLRLLLGIFAVLALSAALIFGVRAAASRIANPPPAKTEEPAPSDQTAVQTPAVPDGNEAQTAASADSADADGTLRHEGMSVRLINDLASETGNYFFCQEKSFQTFRIIRCELYTADGALRIRGDATAVSPAETADKIEIEFFAVGQNQYTEPLLKKTVTVISAGVNEGITVSFDCEAASWEALAGTGEADLLLYLADL